MHSSKQIGKRFTKQYNVHEIKCNSSFVYLNYVIGIDNFFSGTELKESKDCSIIKMQPKPEKCNNKGFGVGKARIFSAYL